VTNMRLKTWILVPMTIAIGIGLFFWGAFYFQQEKEASRQATTRLVSQGQDYYSSLLQQQVRLLQAHAEYLIRNQELIGAWHNRDRDALLELTVPLASEFQQKYKITHFYLVEPDRTVFLRPYNPSRTGGVISRQTMLQAQASGVAVHGLELGSLATLTLRYVTPWYDQDELLGFIELGMETEHILQEMAKMLHVDLISVIRKEFIRRESFEAGTERFGFKGNWDDYPDMVIAHQTISDLPDALHDWLVTGHDAFFGPNNIYAVHRGRHLWGGIIHKPDIAGEDVADLIIIHDATAQMMALRHSMVTNFGVATMLLGSLLLLLYSVTRRAEKSIETAHKLLEVKNLEMEQLVYIVSHDLKSPLVTVKTFAGMLRQDIQDGNQQQISEDLKYIDSSTDKMQQLLDALLKYSRIGRVDTLAQTLSADHQVQNCLATLAGILQQHQVQVSTGKLPQQLHGDPLHFGQIWQNLIENAVKYRGDQPQPHIEIGATQEGQDVVFYVRDNGMGIASEHNERIFNLFSQLNPGSDGSGLGLALVKKIVTIYQGRIWVESDGKSKGSCFMFTLPGALIKGDKAI